MEYETLSMRFQPGPKGSYSVVASGLRGEAAGEFRPPFDERDLENFVLRVGRPRRGVRRLDSPEMQTAKTFGSELFDALFQGDVRDVFHGASAEAESAGKGLRVTLRLGQTPELAHIPWEYLCEEGRFLSVSERTPIVRYLDLKKAHTPLALTPPLRIVAMVSSPSDVVELNVEEEKHRLDQALEALVAEGQVEIVWLERATLTELFEVLERADFHIFHFIGHGAFDEQEGDGVLLLEDERGRGKRVTGMKLGQLLADERTLRLAVLNACEGARSDRRDPFAGVAASLVRNEIPSVVAMQFEITDDAAILFAGGLYSALARGAPIDAAVASARKAIWADYNDIEWGTPVLFMRIPEGRLFDVRIDTAHTAEFAAEGEAALDVGFEAEPDTVDAGEEVSWRLTIKNVGGSALKEVAALSNDGSRLVVESTLPPGRSSLTRWRTKPQSDVEATVTITATDTRGNRIAEQVTAHATVRRPVDAGQTPTTVAEASVRPPEITPEASEKAVPWPSTTRASRRRMTHTGGVTAVAFSLDGRHVVSASSDKTARVWETTSGNEIARMTHGAVVSAVAFSPDGRHVVSASGDKTARVWQASNGNEITRMTHDGGVASVAFSPDGRHVVSAGDDKTARVWETMSGTELARITHTGGITAAAFSPDGRRVVSAGKDKTARVWDAMNGNELTRVTHSSFAAWIRAVAFSPDGRHIVTGSDDRTARVWDATTGQEVARMTHSGVLLMWVTAVAFSPDGRYVVSAGEDKTARVWETTAANEVARMTHDGGVIAVAFSSDGRRVVSGGKDKTARVWQADNGDELGRMTHENAVTAVAFSPDGCTVVSGSTDMTVRVWEVAGTTERPPEADVNPIR